MVGPGLTKQRLYRGVFHQVERLESPAHGVEFGVIYLVIRPSHLQEQHGGGLRHGYRFVRSGRSGRLLPHKLP